jgi:hypothetical protein
LLCKRFAKSGPLVERFCGFAERLGIDVILVSPFPAPSMPAIVLTGDTGRLEGAVRDGLPKNVFSSRVSRQMTMQESRIPVRITHRSAFQSSRSLP